MLYADSSLPPRRRHDHLSCWCFSPFFRRFSASLPISLPLLWLIYCPLPPLRRSCKHAPPTFLGIFQSASFSCTHILYITASASSSSFPPSPFGRRRQRFSARGSKACVPPPPVFSPPCRGAGCVLRTVAGCSAVLTPEWLRLSVISSCFWRSVRTNKMAACCFYSSDTRVGGRGAHGNIRRERGGGWSEGGRGCLRGCSGLSVSRFRARLPRQVLRVGVALEGGRSSSAVCSPLSPVISQERKTTYFPFPHSNLKSI